MRGHVAPAAQAARLRAEDHDLGTDTADGWRLARCLRCDMWVRTVPPAAGTARWEELPSIADLPKPRRGRILHDAILLRVVAIDRAVHAVAFSLVAAAVGVLMVNLTSVHDVATTLIRNLNHSVGEASHGPGGSWLDRELPRLARLEPGALRAVLAVSIAYAVVEGTEAYGLWRERRWAEYLTVLATAGFLPLEIHELTQRITVLRVLALVVNVAILVWLVWSKHLFGVRGGPATLAGSTDWPAVLAGSDTAPVNSSGRRGTPSTAPAPVVGRTVPTGADRPTDPPTSSSTPLADSGAEAGPS